MSTHIDLIVDVKGVCCPLPLIQLAKSLKTLKSGQTLEIIGNDPIFESTIRDFCQANGHAVLESTKDDSHNVSIVIRVGG